MEARAGTSAGAGGGATTPGAPGQVGSASSTSSLAASLLPALKEALEGAASTHELMKELVAAVQVRPGPVLRVVLVHACSMWARGGWGTWLPVRALGCLLECREEGAAASWEAGTSSVMKLALHLC